MNRAVRTILIAGALALPLGGCGSMPDVPNFDPADWISGDIFGTKKPLPGERKALFPEGVPGVARGVPQDLVKGNQPPPGAEGSGIAQEASLLAEEPKPKPKPKAKPKPKVAAKPAPVAPTSTPTSVTVRRSDQPPPQPQQQQQQQATRRQQQRQAPGGVQWPDPPPPPPR